MASVATLPPSAHAYHVYPAPPPTVNQLSSRQKTQLRRSTTKLSKVLGTTPHLVDLYPADPITVSAPRPLNTSSRHTSLQSTSSQSRPTRRLSHKRSKSERLHPDSYPLSSSMHHQHRSSAPAAPRRLSVEATYPVGESSKRPPTLQVHTGSPRSSHRYSQSTGIPYTASSSSSHSKSSSRTTLSEDKPPVAHAIPRKPVPTLNGQTPARDSLCDSLYEPTFTIPSETALRRAKMARVCKRLGEGVPMNLVFPNDASVAEESEDEEPVVREKGIEWEFVNNPSRHQRRASEQIVPVEKTKTADEKRTSSASRYRLLRLDRLSRDSKFSTSTSTSSASAASSGASNSSCYSSSSPSTPACSNPSSPISASPTTTPQYSHSHCRSHSSPSPLPTPTAYTFHEYALDAGMASPAGRREFAVYVPKQHAQRRGSVMSGGKHGSNEYELVRGFGNLGI